MKILVTAGPTREYLDPVRFLSNPSSGKMGYAIAQAAQQKGHEVVLISGPSYLQPPKELQFVSIVSADEMKQQVDQWFEWADGVVMTAAVSDFKPKTRSSQKVKKQDEAALSVEWVQNPDILFELGQKKGKKWLVGFAAESKAILEHAQQKLENKNLDMIVVNDISQKEGGFESDQNQVHLIASNGAIEDIPKMSKSQIAEKLMEKIESKFAS